MWPGNEGAVAVEAFFIPKAQKSTTGAEQSQGAADCFSLTIMGLFTTVMHQKANLSTKNTIWNSS
jgi:hypothetical protein